MRRHIIPIPSSVIPVFMFSSFTKSYPRVISPIPMVISDALLMFVLVILGQ